MKAIQADKIREVVPDLINKIKGIQENAYSIHRSINKLGDALDGAPPEDCAKGEPLMRGDEGSIQNLERVVSELNISINDANMVLIEKLSRLLGS